MGVEGGKQETFEILTITNIHKLKIFFYKGLQFKADIMRL